jgi:hypothetical protein
MLCTSSKGGPCPASTPAMRPKPGNCSWTTSPGTGAGSGGGGAAWGMVDGLGGGRGSAAVCHLRAGVAFRGNSGMANRRPGPCQAVRRGASRPPSRGLRSGPAAPHHTSRAAIVTRDFRHHPQGLFGLLAARGHAAGRRPAGIGVRALCKRPRRCAACCSSGLGELAAWGDLDSCRQEVCRCGPIRLQPIAGRMHWPQDAAHQVDGQAPHVGLDGQR